MVEFGSTPSESSKPHEGEGLSRSHWEILAATSFKDPKINRFAQAVIGDQLEGTSDVYRQYLGNRHWRLIAETLDRKTRGWSWAIMGFRNRQLLNPAKELVKYTRREQEFSYTLDDYYASRGGWVSDVLPGQEEGMLFGGYNSYSWDGAKWTETSHYLAGLDTNGQGGTPASNSWPANHVDIVLQEFLLTFDDVPEEANLKSPQQLIELAKSIDVKTLNDRLTERMRYSNSWLALTPNAYHDAHPARLDIARKERPVFQQVGNWEKEI